MLASSLDLSVWLCFIVGFASGSVPDEEVCSHQWQCPSEQACVQHSCMNPCTLGCGYNTECVVVNHRAECRCMDGYTGDPTVGCVKEGGEECPSVECHHHDSCESSKACIKNRCVDPCPGVCGRNAMCSVKNHIPSCACRSGYTGDPFTECKLQAQETQRQKKTFTVETIKMDWHQAFYHCQNTGRRMATIESMEDFRLLKEAARLKNLLGEEVWIAGQEFPRNKTYTWMTTMKAIPVELQNWGPNQPNMGAEDQHCLNIYDSKSNGHYTLYDDGCFFKYAFACEF